MVINGISSTPIIKNSNNNWKNRKPHSSQPSFTGLNTVAAKTIRPTPDLLQALIGISTREAGFVGNLPMPFIKTIKTNDKTLTVERINNIKTAFGDAGKKLRSLDIDAQKALKDLVATDDKKLMTYMYELIDAQANEDYPRLAKIEQKFREDLRPQNTTKLKNIYNEAGQILDKAFKENGLVPHDAKTNIEMIGEGCVGTAYKISILDKDNNKLFSDKVIKVYKDKEHLKDFFYNKQLIRLLTLKNHGKDILGYIDNKILKLYNNPNTPTLKEGMALTTLRNAYDDKLNALKVTSNKMVEIVAAKNAEHSIKELYKIHGPYVEANQSAYIKKNLGHKLDKSDLIQPYFTNLTDEIALLEYADKSVLGEVTKPTSFKALGVICEDMGTANPDNTVADRLIDYGCFKITNKVIVGNKTARRVFKKVANAKDAQARITLWNNIYQKAKANSLPNSADVMLGLNESVKLIPFEHQHKLDIFANFKRPNFLSDQFE